MLDLLSPDLQPFVGVLALAVLFVVTTGAINRYRAWQAEKMARAQRLLRGAQRIVKALDRLGDLPLPREVAALLGNELLARYRAVLALFPRYEGMDERIEAAESRVRSSRGNAGWEVPSIADQGQLDNYTAGLTAVVGFLQEERPVEPLQPQELRALRERLRTLRAEARYGFVTGSARALAEAGDWGRAQEAMLNLLAFLKQKAPPNERGKMIYREANGIYQQMMRRELPHEVRTEEVAEA